MKKAKKKTKKVGRRITMRTGPKKLSFDLPEGLKAVPKRRVPKGVELFAVWKTREGMLLKITGIPSDPLHVSHILRDIYNAYSKAYGAMTGLAPEEIAAQIISHFGDLVAEDYPDEMLAAVAEGEAATLPKEKIN